MGPRQPGRRGEIVDGDGLGVAGVDQILGPLQITGRRHLRHAANYGVSRNWHPKQYVYRADELAGRPRTIRQTMGDRCGKWFEESPDFTEQGDC
jgi:hypothetical protein